MASMLVAALPNVKLNRQITEKPEDDSTQKLFGKEFWSIAFLRKCRTHFFNSLVTMEKIKFS